MHGTRSESASAVAVVRAWGQVAAAIALVAERRYPRVEVTGIPDAVRVAEAFRQDAGRCGVDLVVDEQAGGTPHCITAQRR
jgi:hypothetical protein